LKYNIGDPEKIWQQKMEEFPGEVVVVGQLVMWALYKKKLCKNVSNNFL
jgi:hypothetical protein